ncbi:hypothetical protein B0H15DRAFT_328233 [Mycena belliarum]|uniref:Uncharacterized protein n=1 Tax=Mycena belliarum TaxID=1033014 RepID=A0AAD6XX35_9AGAR|nr:hypothetical protein B0H15DRAFT_328233 [Mycena belliae]
MTAARLGSDWQENSMVSGITTGSKELPMPLHSISATSSFVWDQGPAGFCKHLCSGQCRPCAERSAPPFCYRGQAIRGPPPPLPCCCQAMHAGGRLRSVVLPNFRLLNPSGGSSQIRVRCTRLSTTLIGPSSKLSMCSVLAFALAVIFSGHLCIIGVRDRRAFLAILRTVDPGPPGAQFWPQTDMPLMLLAVLLKSLMDGDHAPGSIRCSLVSPRFSSPLYPPSLIRPTLHIAVAGAESKIREMCEYDTLAA